MFLTLMFEMNVFSVAFWEGGWGVVPAVVDKAALSLVLRGMLPDVRVIG